MVVHQMDGKSPRMASSSSSRRQKKTPKPRLAVDQQYIDSDVWKCADSPTGAHHWVQNLLVDSGLTLDEMPFVCKFCRGVKFMESFYTYSRWAGWNQPKSSEDVAKRNAAKGKMSDHRPTKFAPGTGYNKVNKGRPSDPYLS